MNRTFPMLTLLALAVVATPAQAIDRQDVCDIPDICDVPALHSCPGILTVWMSPPDVTVNQNCFPAPSPGEESAAAESAGADGQDGCAALEVGLLEAEVGDGCAWSWLTHTPAATADWLAEGPV